MVLQRYVKNVLSVMLCLFTKLSLFVKIVCSRTLNTNAGCFWRIPSRLIKIVICLFVFLEDSTLFVWYLPSYVAQYHHKSHEKIPKT